MTVSQTIVVAVISAAVIGTSALRIILHKRDQKIKKEYLSKEKITQYEKQIKAFYKKHNIEKVSSPEGLFETLGYTIEVTDDLPKGEEARVNKKKKKVKVAKDLSVQEKNFCMAHEVGHLINGCPAGQASRNVHSLKPRSPEEQICDYFAAAILLPLEEVRSEMKKVRYEKLRRKERMKFIADYAEVKDVHVEVVIRRIHEVKMLDN